MDFYFTAISRSSAHLAGARELHYKLLVMCFTTFMYFPCFDTVQYRKNGRYARPTSDRNFAGAIGEK